MSAHRRLFAAVVSFAVLTGCATPGAATGAATSTSMPTLPADTLPGALTYVAGRTALPLAATPTPSPAPATATATPSAPSAASGVSPAGGQPRPSVPAPAVTPSATSAPAGGAAGPVIETFAASTDRVHPGDTVSLTWKTTADRVSLRVALASGQYGQWFDQPGEGSMSYTVPADERNPFSIHLVIGPPENPIYKEVSFSIICPDKWFVDNPPATCPQPAVTGAGAAQRFEHGTMVWGGGSDLIIILRDGSYWNQRPNSWSPGMPESDETLTPPNGLFQPVRGFGKLWREANLRDELGWALAPEFSAPVTYQCDTLFKRSTCILAGPDGPLKLGLWGDWGPYTGP